MARVVLKAGSAARVLIRVSKMKDSISSAIIESMSDGLFVLDFQGYFTHINRAALKILGIHREQVSGNTYMQLFMDFPENDDFNDILFDGIQNREARLYREVVFKKIGVASLAAAAVLAISGGTADAFSIRGIRLWISRPTRNVVPA